MAFSADEFNQACVYLKQYYPVPPRTGIILGTGLGGLVDDMEVHHRIPFRKIPHFPECSATGHTGHWICGSVHGKSLAVMQGRFHLYEGHSPATVTFPIRIMKALGVEHLVVSNASGGLNPAFDSGDLMVIEDHINLHFRNPLVGPNDDAVGPRFPDMSAPYDVKSIQQAHRIANELGFPLRQGVYAALLGPNYETRAEYRMLRRLGADVVGMSTVPEVIAARHVGLTVTAFSAVTNLCRPDTLGTTSGEEVIAAAKPAEPKLRALIGALLKDSY
ncbi:MAG: purine-nucleoside phosphorylase [Pirellulaceae bacterium]